MFCRLGTQLFIVALVVIKLKLFESEGAKSLVESASESSKRLTINQPVTLSACHAKFIKVLDKFEVQNCHLSVM